VTLRAAACGNMVARSETHGGISGHSAGIARVSVGKPIPDIGIQPVRIRPARSFEIEMDMDAIDRKYTVYVNHEPTDGRPVSVVSEEDYNTLLAAAKALRERVWELEAEREPVRYDHNKVIAYCREHGIKLDGEGSDGIL